MKDFAPEPLIPCDERPSLRLALRLSRGSGIAPTVAHRVRSLEIMRSLAANGEGVGISYTRPPGDLSYDGARVCAVAIADRAAREPIILARTGGLPETPVVAAASAAIREKFNQARGPDGQGDCINEESYLLSPWRCEMSGDAELIMTAVQRLAAFWRSSQWQTTGAVGLNPTQGEVLQRIARRSARLGELAEQLGISQASLSDTVSSLEARGLALRRPDPDDGRARRIEATDDGHRVVAQLSTAPQALEHAIASLGDPDRGALARGLVRVIRALQEARAIPVQRMCVTCRHFRPHAHDDPERPHHCAFVDAAFGDAQLRLDCDDHEAAPAEEADAIRRRFEMA